MAVFNATQKAGVRLARRSELITAYALIDEALQLNDNRFFVMHFDKKISDVTCANYHSLACQLSSQISLNIETKRQSDIRYFVSLGASLSNFHFFKFHITKFELVDARKYISISDSFTNRALSVDFSSQIWSELEQAKTFHDYANLAVRHQVSIRSLVREVEINSSEAL